MCDMVCLNRLDTSRRRWVKALLVLFATRSNKFCRRRKLSHQIFPMRRAFRVHVQDTRYPLMGLYPTRWSVFPPKSKISHANFLCWSHTTRNCNCRRVTASFLCWSHILSSQRSRRMNPRQFRVLVAQ